MRRASDPLPSPGRPVDLQKIGRRVSKLPRAPLRSMYALGSEESARQIAALCDPLDQVKVLRKVVRADGAACPVWVVVVRRLATTE